MRQTKYRCYSHSRKTKSFHFLVSIEDTDADNEGEVYKDGVEVDDSEAFGNLEKVQSDFPSNVFVQKETTTSPTWNLTNRQAGRRVTKGRHHQR